jgi:hypothetical protein
VASRIKLIFIGVHLTMAINLNRFLAPPPKTICLTPVSQSERQALFVGFVIFLRKILRLMSGNWWEIGLHLGRAGGGRFASPHRAQSDGGDGSFRNGGHSGQHHQLPDMSQFFNASLHQKPRQFAILPARSHSMACIVPRASIEFYLPHRVLAQNERRCYEVPSEHRPLAHRNFRREDFSPVAVSNFPEMSLILLANSRRQVVGRKLGEIGRLVKAPRRVFEGRNEFANSIEPFSGEFLMPSPGEPGFGPVRLFLRCGASFPGKTPQSAPDGTCWQLRYLWA